MRGFGFGFRVRALEFKSSGSGFGLGFILEFRVLVFMSFLGLEFQISELSLSGFAAWENREVSVTRQCSRNVRHLWTI